MEVAWVSGRREAALAIVEQARFWRSLELNPNQSPFYSHAYERFARAELLYELGRYDEALRWYRTIADWLVCAGGPAHLRLAEIHERRGERVEAIRHYVRFIEWGEDCGAELRPLVDDVRERLTRLGAGK